MLTIARIGSGIGCLGVGWFAGAGLGADFSDLFAGRELVSGDALVVLGANGGATREAGEPRHAGRLGGHSLWLSWIAPADGLVTLSTAGSGFDTLLAVYTLEAGDDPPLERLQETADGDDEEGASSSAVAFGARAGERYEIAVDGFAGATGSVRLSLELLGAGTLLPRIVRSSGDQALREGDTLILTVDIQPVEQLELRWFFNRREMDDAEEPTLILRDFRRANTGFYELRAQRKDLAFFSAPIEVQINSEGETAVLARNKLEEAADTGLAAAAGGRAGNRLPSLAGPDAGVTRGYNGTQVFNTSYATRDPQEPQHCGVAGGPSYWFAYQPPANGTLHLDTNGSDYDTLLALYTYDPPLTGFASLVPVACDDNGGADGRTSRFEFATDMARAYFIVVDGVNGARGIAHLNYRLLATDPPPPTPVITRQPESRTVAVGNTIALTVVASGAVPMRCQWLHDGARLATETNGTLTLRATHPADGGRYWAEVSNAAGSVTSAEARVEVRLAPAIELHPETGRATLSFPATRGYEFQLVSAAEVQASGWSRLATPLADSGGMVQVDTELGSAPQRFYRLLPP